MVNYTQNIYLIFISDCQYERMSLTGDMVQKSNSLRQFLGGIIGHCAVCEQPLGLLDYGDKDPNITNYNN